jgi:hypothetical protein
MFGGGFIQQMVNKMKENKSLMPSKRNRFGTHLNDGNDTRQTITRLNFPRTNSKRLAHKKRKLTRKSQVQWILIYVFFTLFFGLFLWFVFA